MNKTTNSNFQKNTKGDEMCILLLLFVFIIFTLFLFIITKTKTNYTRMLRNRFCLINVVIQCRLFLLTYRKISNISPGLIDIFKHIFGGLCFGGLIFRGHFVLVSAYQDFKVYYHIN